MTQIIPLIQMKRKDFLNQFNKTLSFHPTIKVEYPNREGRTLHITHNVSFDAVVDKNANEEYTDIFLESCVKEAKKFQHKIDNVFKKSTWRYLTDNIYRRCYDDIENNHKAIIEQLWSPQHTEKESRHFIQKREAALEEVISVPDYTLFQNQSVYVVMLNQRLSMTSIDEEPLIMLHEYKLFDARISEMYNDDVYYDLTFQGLMVEEHDEYTPYNKIHVALNFDKKNKVFSVRQGYSDLILLLNKDEAVQLFEESKKKLMAKIMD